MHSKFDQAVNFFENGNLNESKKLCLEILKDEPKNFDILHLLGIISFKLEDYKMSTDLIAKAVTINPKNAEAYNNQSIVFKKINKLEDAIEIVNEDFVVGGMKPKITTCIEAMKNGVTKSTILDGRIPHSLVLELFTEHGIGTQIYS